MKKKSICQIMSGTDHLAIVKVADAKRIALRAIPKYPKTQPELKEQYLEANVPTIFVLTNCWLFLVQQESERTMRRLQRYLMEYGLPNTIRVSDELADALVHQESDLSSLAGYAIWFDCFARVGDEPDAMRTALELLRFPKRYSPAYQDDVTEKGIADFLEVNRSRRWLPAPESRDQYCPTVNFDGWYFLPDIIRVVSEIIQDTPLAIGADSDELGVQQVESKFLSKIEFDCDFSTGAIAEENAQGSTLMRKLQHLSQVFPNFKGVQYPLIHGSVEIWDKPGQKLHVFIEAGNGAIVKRYNTSLMYPRNFRWALEIPCVEMHGCVVKAVPKSFKTPRIIAKEPAWRNYLATGARICTIQKIKEKMPEIWYYFDVEQQDLNRELCWEASWQKHYATVDVSSASDSISAGLGCTLFPAFRKLGWLRSDQLILDKKYTNNIFLTSGHPLTFLCETIFYYSVAKVATEYTALWYDRRYKFYPPRVFGDDVLIDVRAYELFIEMLTALNIKVNVEKSFSNPSDYRESCGVEYLHGYPMHGVKWPRTTFDWSRRSKLPDYVESLVQLQHSLYAKSWKANDFLCDIVTHLEPAMTFSKPYDPEAVDLWSDIYVPKKVLAPYLKVKGEEPSSAISERELHAVLTPNYANHNSMYESTNLIEVYLYVRFLMYGPVYASELDRLLNVTTPVDRKPLITKPTNRWVVKRR